MENPAASSGAGISMTWTPDEHTAPEEGPADHRQTSAVTGVSFGAGITMTLWTPDEGPAEQQYNPAVTAVSYGAMDWLTPEGHVAPEEGLRHDPGMSTDWTPEEQAALEEALAEPWFQGPVSIRYAKIAGRLVNKTARDVALRGRWTAERESGRRRREEEDEYSVAARKRKEKKKKRKERAEAEAGGPPLDLDDGGFSLEEIGGGVGDHLAENELNLNRIRENVANHSFVENKELFELTHLNIAKAIAVIKQTMPFVIKMPQLPSPLKFEKI